MIIDDLLEARKNPELNTKLDIVQGLGHYMGEDGYYFHYSNIVKIGVKPQTEHFTPAGVYAYNLKREYNNLVNKKIPYAHDRKYVFLIKAIKPITPILKYSVSDWKRDKQKLINMYQDKRFSLSMDTTTFEDLVDNAIRRGMSPDELEFHSLSIEDLIKVAVMTVKDRLVISCMWNTTRLITMDKEAHDPDPFVWNKILRSLGYSIFDDPGKGVIHPNEPSQALFLTPDTFVIVDMFENKRREGIR